MKLRVPSGFREGIRTVDYLYVYGVLTVGYRTQDQCTTATIHSSVFNSHLSLPRVRPRSRDHSRLPTNPSSGPSPSSPPSSSLLPPPGAPDVCECESSREPPSPPPRRLSPPVLARVGRAGQGRGGEGERGTRGRDALNSQVHRHAPSLPFSRPSHPSPPSSRPLLRVGRQGVSVQAEILGRVTGPVENKPVTVSATPQ